MKADFSTTDLVHIQVASRLSDLLFDELQKINIDGAPPSAQRIHLKALERAGAINATWSEASQKWAHPYLARFRLHRPLARALNRRLVKVWPFSLHTFSACILG